MGCNFGQSLSVLKLVRGTRNVSTLPVFFSVWCKALKGRFWNKASETWIHKMIRGILLTLIWPYSTSSAERWERNLECGSNPNLRHNTYSSIHLGYDLLAYAKPESCSPVVLFRVLLQFLKVNKQILQPLSAEPWSLISDFEGKLVAKVLIVRRFDLIVDRRIQEEILGVLVNLFLCVAVLFNVRICLALKLLVLILLVIARIHDLAAL